MTKRTFLTVLLCIVLGAVVVGIVSFLLTLQYSTHEKPLTDTTEERETVADIVTLFGKKIANVPLGAPATDTIAASIEENYAEFLDPILLNIWKMNPTMALGRKTSSPWPDRIDIGTMTKVGDDRYTVMGTIAEVTSAEATGDATVHRPVRIELQRQNGTWRIVGAAASSIIPNDEPVACTMEAKLCPDGSYVGRTGPNCEFAACPATRTVKLYYFNNELDKDASGSIACSRNGLVAVDRTIPASQTPIQDAIKLLLSGNLTTEERAKGISTEYPLQGFSLKSAALANGVLTLEFSDPSNKTTGGSCRVGILWYQIEATAKQFPEVKEVRFKPEELFQP